uniref:Uncharacterized protein n=1 Tax=Timema tahoe TaxID=61484 RepID=A0A7R9IAN1_9NEOP|nr:unnamed protein product [Timema tahoe]
MLHSSSDLHIRVLLYTVCLTISPSSTLLEKYLRVSLFEIVHSYNTTYRSRGASSYRCRLCLAQKGGEALLAPLHPFALILFHSKSVIWHEVVEHPQLVSVVYILRMIAPKIVKSVDFGMPCHRVISIFVIFFSSTSWIISYFFMSVKKVLFPLISSKL